ncbi:hypothetical protein A0H76_197 [Hepatospora eriocheir]|uniref:Uncharacterized protein n=1 Tax=Hepatospora eriocheir TaxID=1081669 RepID=A0A1X0QJ91_9MICR|nr:hypothetical protein A0H76_197 [Hepatospora eriocheir]
MSILSNSDLDISLLFSNLFLHLRTSFILCNINNISCEGLKGLLTISWDLSSTNRTVTTL